MSDSPLSQYLRMLRTQNNYTQDELAKYLGVTRSTYSHYENARLMPPTDSLYKLSAFYKISLSKLIRLSGHDKRLMNYFMKLALLKDTSRK